MSPSAIPETTTNGSNGIPFPPLLEDQTVENFRPIKVIVIGAGFSGIYCGIRIPQRIRNVDLTIYEKNSGIGGTWWENRYPGCACDIPCKIYFLSNSKLGPFDF
jgi:NAD(P)-binding Rossmann-like domain